MFPIYNNQLPPDKNPQFWSSLGAKDLKKRSTSSGETLFHEAAIYDSAKFIKPELFTNELLSQETLHGESVYLYLAKFNMAKLIPKELLTKGTLLKTTSKGESLLLKIIESNNIEIIDHKLLDEGILLESSPLLSTTYLHFCAACIELKNIPEHIWANQLNLKDSFGNNLLHWALIGKAKKNLVKTQDMSHLIYEQNNFGETPLHKTPYLTEVPKEFLNTKSLGITNQDGDTPIHKSARSASTQFLPINTLNEQLLLIKNNKKETPIDQMVKTFREVKDRDNFEKIVKYLSQKSLKELNKKPYPKDMKEIIKSELKRSILKTIGNQNTLEIP